MDKIIRINVGTDNGPEITVEGLGNYSGLGGRAMTSTIISQEVPADCHPLGSENKLVFAPGMMCGTAASTSGRLSVGCKSPLTGGIKEANVGGQAGQVMARLGYAAIILESKPQTDDIYNIIINKNGIQAIKVNEYKGLGNYALTKKIKDNTDHVAAIMSVGVAGEMCMSAATIAVTDVEFRPSRHAGRGGVGAVMGSKGIKAIVLDDQGCSMRKPHNQEDFKAANKKFFQGLKQHSVTGEALPAYGSNVLTNIINEAGAYPTYNFKQGQFDGAENISGETLAALETERGGNPTHGCHRGCAIKCSGIYVDKKGNYITKQPEYETIWAHGGHCGIDDMDTIAQLDYMDDDFGLDTIETGVAIGVAMEGGLLAFGDTKGAIRLVQEIGKGTPLGRIIGNGAAFTAQAFGVERVPVVKRQAMPAYDPRAVKGIGVTYATTPMGADHTAGYAIASNILKVGGDVDPLSSEGQIELSRNLQIATAALDSTGFCLFIAFAILDQPDTFDAMLGLINAMYGLEMTADDVVALGKQVLTVERDFNRRAGFSNEDDRLPRFFSQEPISPHNVTFDITDDQLDTLFKW